MPKEFYRQVLPTMNVCCRDDCDETTSDTVLYGDDDLETSSGVAKSETAL